MCRKAVLYKMWVEDLLISELLNSFRSGSIFSLLLIEHGEMIFLHMEINLFLSLVG